MKNAIIAIAGATLAAAASAQTFPSFLDGSQEVPATPSAAIGFADFEFDPMTSTFDLFLVLDGISVNDIVGFHVHNAPTGVNGPVVVDLLNLGMFLPDPVVPMLSTFEVSDVPLSGVLANELFSKNLYLNIHTNAFTTGEIRGQIVPAPGAAIALSAFGLFAARRRR